MYTHITIILHLFFASCYYTDTYIHAYTCACTYKYTFIHMHVCTWAKADKDILWLMKESIERAERMLKLFGVVVSCCGKRQNQGGERSAGHFGLHSCFWTQLCWIKVLCSTQSCLLLLSLFLCLFRAPTLPFMCKTSARSFALAIDNSKPVFVPLWTQFCQFFFDVQFWLLLLYALCCSCYVCCWCSFCWSLCIHVWYVCIYIHKYSYIHTYMYAFAFFFCYLCLKFIISCSVYVCM